jgi:hypothetical protein
MRQQIQAGARLLAFAVRAIGLWQVAIPRSHRSHAIPSRGQSLSRHRTFTEAADTSIDNFVALTVAEPSEHCQQRP